MCVCVCGGGGGYSYMYNLVLNIKHLTIYLTGHCIMFCNLYMYIKLQFVCPSVMKKGRRGRIRGRGGKEGGSGRWEEGEEKESN